MCAAQTESKDVASPSSSQTPLVAQICLVFLVVFCGAGNLVTKQIAAKTLGRFDYVLGLISAAAYVIVYWAILGGLHFSGSIQDVPGQVWWVWCKRSRFLCITSGPVILLFAMAALGDSLGDVLGMLSTPYVSGPVHALLAQCTTVFTALLSLCMLQKRFSLVQCASLATVICATALGVLPNLAEQGANGSSPFFSFVIAISCAGNAFAFVAKELVFNSYRMWAKDASEATNSSLNIFVANSSESTMQLPLTLLLLPLAEALGQTHGDPLGSYLGEAFACAAGSQDVGTGKERCEYAPLCTFLYIFFNLAFNISILLSVKWNGAVGTFVALKAVMPTSALLFAYVEWPLLGATPLRPVTWVSLSIVIPIIAVFTYESRQQDQRAQKGQASCCWPLCTNEDDSRDESGKFAPLQTNDGDNS